MKTLPMKTLLLALLLLFSPTVTEGQSQSRKPAATATNCKMTIDQAPLVRGLKLGQSFDQLQRVLPRIVKTSGEDPDEYGLRRFRFSPAVLENPETLNGVTSVSLAYFDNSLFSIEITYSDIKWQSNLHFVAAIANQLKLPREGWQQADPSILMCQGFFVEVADVNKLRMMDLRFPARVVQRKAEVQAKQKSAFKP